MSLVAEVEVMMDFKEVGRGRRSSGGGGCYCQLDVGSVRHNVALNLLKSSVYEL